MAVTPPITGDLIELFPDTLVAEARTSTSGGLTAHGYGAGVALPARISEKTVVVRGFDGQDKVSHVQARLGGYFGVTPEHRFTLPARFVPGVVKAVAVECYTDENGPHHERVYF